MIKVSDGLSLYVDVKGEGPGVLFSHGLSGSARNWRATIAALPGYRCLAYDVLGHSRSDTPSSSHRYHIDALVQDMVDILDHFNMQRASLIGLSMGAALSLKFALTHTDRVKSLVLSSFPNQAPTQGGVSGYAAAFSKAILEEGLEKAGEQFVWGEQSGLSPRDASMVRLGYMGNSAVGIANILSGLFVNMKPLESDKQALQTLDLPVLVLAGERDTLSVRASEKLMEYLPNAHCHFIPKGGHLINIDSKQKYNEHIRVFFQGIYQCP